MKRVYSLARRAACWFLALTVLTQVHSAQAQGTAFTYQGRLNSSGAAVSGNYDLRFTIFDSSGGATVVGEPLTNSVTGISNGLFAVTLDFGANVFTGPARWLEISARTNGPGSFTTLSPRQPLTPSPYAIYAGTASNVVADTVVKSLNNLKDAVTLAAGSNVTITPSGNTLTIASDPQSGAALWKLNNTNAYYNVGNVGIGTTTPATALEANGIVRSTRIANPAQFLQLDGGDPASIRLTAQSVVSAEKSLLIQNLSGEATPGANNAIDFVLGTTTSPSVKMTLTKDGNVVLPLGGTGGNIGIGTPNGETGMTISGANRADLRFDGSVLKLVAGTGTGIPSQINGIAIKTSGDVGVGTAFPGAKLDVLASTGTGVRASTGSGDAVNAFSSGGRGIFAEAFTGVGVWAQSDSGLAIVAAGYVQQSRDKGGFVKAMALIHVDRPNISSQTATVVRCFNGNANNSTGNCLFTVSANRNSATVNFGFTVNDRFVSVTGVGGDTPSIFNFPDPTSVTVLCGFDDNTDFFVFVF